MSRCASISLQFRPTQPIVYSEQLRLSLALLNLLFAAFPTVKVKVKVMFTLEQATHASLYSFFNLGARCGWVVNATPRPLYPQERPGTHCTGAGWASRPVWRVVENIAPPTGIRSPDSPARSESLYRLSHAGPVFTTVLTFNVKITLGVWIQVPTSVVILSPFTNYENVKLIIYISFYRNSVIRKFNVTWPLSLIHFTQQSRNGTSGSVKYDLWYRYRPKYECYNRRHICALRCALHKLLIRERRYSWHLQRKASTKWSV